MAGAKEPMVARLLLCALALLALVGCATPLAGRVVGVTDGDTITVLDSRNSQYKIRLGGIDAPEKAQPFGQQAKAFLSELVFGRQVKVETGKQDRYGRTVGKVFVDERDANLAMVDAGLAWHYKAYANEQSPKDRLLYADAEREARMAQRGLWIEPGAAAPWNWRRNKKAVEEP